MGDDDKRVLGGFHPREEFRDRAERVDIEPALDLVEDDVLGMEEFHLEYLYLPFLPARKPDIEITVQEWIGNRKLLREGRQIPPAKKRGKSLGSGWDIPVMDRPEIFSKTDPPNLRDILKREKKSLMAPFIWGHDRQIFPIEGHSPLLYPVFRVPHKGQRERTFPAPVLSKEKIGLPSLERHVYIPENIFSFYGNPKILYMDHVFLMKKSYE